MMPFKKGPSSANNAALPYPLTTEEQARLMLQEYADNNANSYRTEPYSPPAALASPDFDMRNLSDALPTPQQSKGKGLEIPGSLRAGGAPQSPLKSKEKEIPDSLRVGGGGSGRVSPAGDRSDGEVKRSSTELRRNYQRGDVPDILRAGASRKSAELQRPVSPGLPSSLMAPSAPKSTAPSAPKSMLAPSAPKSMSVPLVPAAPPLLPSPASPAPAPQTPAPQTPQPLQTTPSSDHSSPALMTASLSATDRPFHEYSPFYSPPNIVERSDPSQQLPPVRPPIAPSNSDDERQRNYSIASTASTFSVLEPGADLSSFDASFSRALPGCRGEPVVGMAGWQEAAHEEESAAKTWEEDLERRAKVGTELQRRAEEAQMRMHEEKLQQQFWEQEQLDWTQQAEMTAPAKPPKELITGPGVAVPAALAPNNPWNDRDGMVTPTPTHPPSRQPSPAVPVPAVVSSTPLLPRRTVDPTTEIYTIKQVNLVSPLSGSLHRFPILLQNANGPCPLMALVNAITISTPPSERSALSEVLRQREQVSLSLLLQGVFEELMTRTQDGRPIPDVGDMFAFLITLHTGMNVNPRFNVPAGSLGAFEPTTELDLYAAFSIPLVHGWLPTPGSPAAQALEKSAKTYDETQTLLFAEDELITKLTTYSNAVASSAENQILRDAPVVREFIESTATQLTPYGLDTLRRFLPELRPAILFRNDHFSTIVRLHDGDLVALVTDMGFAGHEEVVWERIADVNGRGNVFLSGDFRAVGGNGQPTGSPPPPQPPRPPPQQVQSMLNPDAAPPPPPPRAPSTQHAPPPDHHDEDYDLALAMQLQEEEDAHGQQQYQQHQQYPPPQHPPPQHPHPQNAHQRSQSSSHLQQPPTLPPRQAGGTTPPPPYDFGPARNRAQSAGNPPGPATNSGGGDGRSAWIESQQRLTARRGSGVHRIDPIAPTAAGGPGHGNGHGNGNGDRPPKEPCVIM